MSKFVPNSPYAREELREEVGIAQGLNETEIEATNPVGARVTNSAAWRRVLRGIGGRMASTPGTRAYRRALIALEATLAPIDLQRLFANGETGSILDFTVNETGPAFVPVQIFDNSEIGALLDLTTNEV